VKKSLPDLPCQVVTQPSELPACLEHIAASHRFGFDTEFVGEDSYHPHLCLVQVATEERLILIDPLSVGPLDAFWQLVVDPANLVVVHAGREEVRLCQLWAGQLPGNLFDLQIAAGMVGLANYPIGHASLVGQLFRVQLAKAETLTEWRSRPLTQHQIQYAFDDVRYLLPAWHRLTERLEKLERLDWAREEFGRLATVVTRDEPTLEKWRKLRGVGSLDRRGLAVARALYAWREQQGIRTNRPVRALIRDDLVVEIARKNPSRTRDLQVIRGLPHRDLDAILQVVTEARALPVEQMPAVIGREIDPPQLTWITNILVAVLGQLCVERRLAPGLVASNNDVRLIVRARLQGADLPAESILTRGWRAVHILPHLLALLDGQRWLRIANPLVETPFAFQLPPADGDSKSV
jgi:ribonuclease D